MLEFIGDALGAIISGGVTGILGSVITTWGEYRKNKLMFSHKEKMAELDQQAMKLEAELELKKITTESEAQQAIAEMDILKSSYEHDRATYSRGKLGKFGRALMVVVDFARGMIRPSATIYLVVLTTIIFYKVFGILNGLESAIPVADAVAIVNKIIMVVLYLTVMVVSWWFGMRQKILKEL